MCTRRPGADGRAVEFGVLYAGLQPTQGQLPAKTSGTSAGIGITARKNNRVSFSFARNKTSPHPNPLPEGRATNSRPPGLASTVPSRWD